MQNAKIKVKICNLQSAIDQRGFTLVELLVAMAIASVIGLAGVSLFSTSNWAYKVNEDVAEAQQNARVSMERLAKDIRAAGFGLPDPPFSLSFINLSATAPTLPNPLTSPITVTNSSAGNDTITILGIGSEAGVLSGTNAGGQTFLCYARTTSDEKLIGADSMVVPNRQYISIGGSLFVTLDTTSAATGVCNGAGTARLPLSSPATLARAYDAGTVVYIIQAVQYTVTTDTAVTGCSSNNPCLVSRDYTMLRGGSTPGARELLAENIEDIQFAYGVDGTIGPDFTKDGKLDSSTLSNDPADDSSILAVRATVVAKTRTRDMKGRTFTRPAIEDHSASAADNYRRRSLTKIIKLRNPRTGG